jgi:hypothetical protein
MLRELKKPEGASFYMTDGRNEFIGYQPQPGNRFCHAITGETENQLVQEILKGKWDAVMHGDTAC